MASLPRIVDRVVGRLALDTEDPTALGLTRILLVSVFTLALLTHVGALDAYFSNDSVLAGEFARQAFPSRFSVFFYVENPWAVRAIFALGLVAHIMWLVGRHTRIAAFIAWLLWVSMMGRHPLLYSLADQMHMALCTLLMVMPSGNGLSLDAKRNGPKPVPVWCRRIIQLQMAVVYVGTGLAKEGVTWRADGTALYFAASNPYNRHFEIAGFLAAIQPYILRPFTWAVLGWEIGFGPFLVLHWLRGLLNRPRRFPDLRKPFLGFGIAIHVGIQVLMYVAWFSPLAIASYAAFLRPDEARRILDAIGRRLRRTKNPSDNKPSQDSGDEG